MKLKIATTAAELGFGALIGYVSYLLGDQSSPLAGSLAVAIGLLSSVLAAHVMTPFLVGNEVRDLKASVDTLTNQLADRLRESAELADVLRYSSARIPREHHTRLWLDLLWRMSTRYWTIAYVSMDEIWNSSLANLALAIQSAKIRVERVDIRRVFIVDNDAEIERLRPIIAEQCSAGIQVRVISKSVLHDRDFLRKAINQLPSLDMTLVDSRKIWFVNLGKDRRVIDDQLVVDAAKCAACEDIYRVLFEAAQELITPPGEVSVRHAPPIEPVLRAR